jgi:hypothetical protein
MSRKRTKKPPDSCSRPRKTVRPADGPNLRADGPDSCPTKTELSPSGTSRYAIPAICAFLLLTVALVFGQTARHAFINLDDGEYVYKNTHIEKGLIAKEVIWALTHGHHYVSCPLTWWSYMMDYQFSGPKPWGYHLTNVLLHAATAILLFLVLRGMAGRLWPSTLVAVLFAIHPLRRSPWRG